MVDGLKLTMLLMVDNTNTFFIHLAFPVLTCKSLTLLELETMAVYFFSRGQHN